MARYRLDDQELNAARRVLWQDPLRLRDAGAAVRSAAGSVVAAAVRENMVAVAMGDFRLVAGVALDTMAEALDALGGNLEQVVLSHQRVEGAVTTMFVGSSGPVGPTGGDG